MERVGKSVELRRAISRLIASGVSSRRIFYCSCDGFRPQDLRRLFAVGRNLTHTVEEPRCWFIDEVTAVGPAWSAVIKDLRDHTPVRHDLVVLTGSSARGFREAVKNLAGRRGGAEDSDRLLLPMRFRDFCAVIGGMEKVPAYGPIRPKDMQGKAAFEAIGELSYWIEELNNAWSLYTQIGGFPRCVSDYLQHGEVQAGFVNDMWDVLRGDAISATTMADPEILALLERIGQSMTTPLNASSVANDLGLGSHHGVNDRVENLSVNFLAWRCFQLIDGQPSIKARRKVYFIDPFIARLAELKAPHHQAPDATKLSEQQLGLSLAGSIEREHQRSFIESSGVFYAVPATKEVDFVGPRLELPFESKYSDKNLKQEAIPAQTAYRRGIIATNTVLNTNDTVWLVPVAIACGRPSAATAIALPPPAPYDPHAMVTSAGQEGAGPEGTRPMVYCLVPRDLAAELHDPLRKHFGDDPRVEVVVERRRAQRRRGEDRRRGGEEPPAAERRLVRAVAGRRVADRRSAAVGVEPPRSLPRKARPHADRLIFFERVEPSTQELEDADTARLVARFQAGDRDVFATLYTRYFDRVYGYLRVALDDRHEAEDATQQVFMQVLEALPRYERRSQPFRAWLFMVVRNYVIWQLKRQRRVDVVDPFELSTYGAMAGNGEEQDRLVPELDWLSDRDLLVLIERLPRAQRQVLVLRYMVGLKPREIADVLGTTANHASVLQYRALGFLRQRLTALGRGPRTRRGEPMRRRFQQAPVLRSRRFMLTP